MRSSSRALKLLGRSFAAHGSGGATAVQAAFPDLNLLKSALPASSCTFHHQPTFRSFHKSGVHLLTEPAEAPQPEAVPQQPPTPAAALDFSNPELAFKASSTPHLSFCRIFGFIFR